ncbi:MAG: tetratricopeptide repeat protein, partial [Bacteroidota bacterium]
MYSQHLYPYFLFCLFFTNHVSSGALSSDTSDLSTPLIPPIERPTDDYTPLHDKGRPSGGSSFDIQFFQENESGKIWIGKCGIKSLVNINEEEYREWLGLAMYRFFDVLTPDFVVSKQKVAPDLINARELGDYLSPDGRREYRIHYKKPCLHIMTQFMEGFTTFGEHFLEDYKKAAEEKRPFFLHRDGKKISLRGFGEMLAMGDFIYDMDCLGVGGGNAGSRIRDGYAQVVKIDPGFAFSFLEEHSNEKMKHNPMDRAMFFGPRDDTKIAYSELTLEDQAGFSRMAKRILKTPRATFKKIIDQVVRPGGWSKEKAETLLDQLIARKSLFLAGYADEVNTMLKEEIFNARQRLFQSLARPDTHAPLTTRYEPKDYRNNLYKTRSWKSKVTNNYVKNQPNQLYQAKTFQLPMADASFTGRESTLTQIVQDFQSKKGVFQVIKGIGGIGKTTLACHYANACARQSNSIPIKYKAVLWFYADVGLESQFQELARTWGHDVTSTQEAIDVIYQKLSDMRALLIFDNVEPTSDLALYLPPDPNKPIHTLLTSRSAHIDSLSGRRYEVVALDRFTQKEGRRYIQHEIEEEKYDDCDMDTLTDTVYGVPLALKQAVQYIKEGKTTLQDYPALFANHQLSLGTQMTASPVVTTLLLSMLTLRQENPTIEPLLFTTAYLSADNISVEVAMILTAQNSTDLSFFVYKFFPYLSNGFKVLVLLCALAAVMSSDENMAMTLCLVGIAMITCVLVLRKFFTKLYYSERYFAMIAKLFDNDIYTKQQEGLHLLDKYGLLTMVDENTVRVHRLVQCVLRAWHLQQQGGEAQDKLLSICSSYFCNRLSHEEKGYSSKKRASHLVPHAWAVAQIPSQSPECLNMQLNLCQLVYKYQLFLTQYPLAQLACEHALKLIEGHHKENHLEFIAFYDYLGHAYSYQGKYSKAMEIFTKGLDLIKEKQKETPYKFTAKFYEYLGFIYFRQEQYKKAMDMFNKALRIDKKIYKNTKLS